MKTTVNFNKNLESVTVSYSEIKEKTDNQELKDYLGIKINYETFCKNQTKRGQSRKNERARARKSMFNGLDTNRLDDMLIAEREIIKKEKDAKIEKIQVEIEFDGRKRSNLNRIIAGVRMAIFTGCISPQYYGIGLVDFKIVK